MEEINLKYSSDKTLNFTTKSCAILWANWTWKSSFSRKIIQLNNSWKKIQAISAQRNLTFKQWSLKWNQDDFAKKFENLKIDIFLLKSDTKFKKDFYKDYIQQKFNQNLENYNISSISLSSDSSRSCRCLLFTRSPKPPT